MTISQEKLELLKHDLEIAIKGINEIRENLSMYVSNLKAWREKIQDEINLLY